MKQTKLVFFITAALLLLYGCSKAPSGGDSAMVKTPVNIAFGSLEPFSPSFLQIEDSLVLEESDDVLFGTIDQCQVVGDCIYLLDNYRSNILAMYSVSDGHLIRYKKAEGNGPGEFLWPYSFYVDEKSNSLYVMDQINKKLIHYNASDWSYIDDTNLPAIGVRSFVVLDSGDVVYYVRSQADSAELGNNQIVVVDDQGHVKKTMYPDPGSGSYNIGGNASLKRVGDEISFIPYFSASEYGLRDDSLFLRHSYQWKGISTAPMELFQNGQAESKEVSERINEGDFLRALSAHHSDNLTALRYWVKRQQYVSLYNAQTGVSRNFMPNEYFPLPVTATDGRIVGAVMDDEGGITLYFYRF